MSLTVEQMREAEMQAAGEELKATLRKMWDACPLDDRPLNPKIEAAAQFLARELIYESMGYCRTIAEGMLEAAAEGYYDPLLADL